jgi:hypothetical protein
MMLKDCCMAACLPLTWLGAAVDEGDTGDAFEDDCRVEGLKVGETKGSEKKDCGALNTTEFDAPADMSAAACATHGPLSYVSQILCILLTAHRGCE